MYEHIIYSAYRCSSDSFSSFAYSVSMQSNVLPIACFCFSPLGSNAELISLASFGLNYVYRCLIL